jgi:DNA-binding transcriptional LysR family regulator
VPLRPEDLADHDLVHFSTLRQGRTWTYLRDGQRTDVAIVPRWELSDALALREAALQGAGIVQLPTFTIGRDLRAGRLVPVLQDWSGRTLHLRAVYPDNRLIAARVRAFVTFLAAKAKGEPDLQVP